MKCKLYSIVHLSPVTNMDSTLWIVACLQHINKENKNAWDTLTNHINLSSDKKMSLILSSLIFYC
jgi:hypothetical protein